jgi:hypothetical protein
MRPIALTIICYLLFSVVALGQAGSKRDLKYKPKTLDEAVLQLEKMHHDTTKQRILAMTEAQFRGNAHFGLGLWMRNNWGLWKGTELSRYFNSIGISHPDDMSGIILTSYYRHLKGQDRELEKQVKHYQEYWKATTEPPGRLETDTSHQRQTGKTRMR